MDYTIEDLQQLIDNATNPVHKRIYGNHLKRLMGKKPQCGACNLDSVEEVETQIDEGKIEALMNPVNQDDEE